MKTGDNGVDLIASFEQCRLKAYKNPGERYYTIGYGHYGPDVKPDQTITKIEAVSYLKRDLATAEKYVNTYVKTFIPNQNQYDALVSYCFNRGPKGLKQLCDASITAEDFSKNIVIYWGSNISCKKGIMRRREAEKKLFDTPYKKSGYPMPKTVLKRGAKGDEVRWVQVRLNRFKAGSVKVDGDFGPLTEKAIVSYQARKGLNPNGVVDAATISKLKKEAKKTEQ